MPQSSRTIVTSRTCADQREASPSVAPEAVIAITIVAKASFTVGRVRLKKWLLLILLGRCLRIDQETEYTGRRRSAAPADIGGSLHEHARLHSSVTHTHTHTHSRRDFFSKAFGGILLGASVFEEAYFRATWARAQSPT